MFKIILFFLKYSWGNLLFVFEWKLDLWDMFKNLDDNR